MFSSDGNAPNMMHLQHFHGFPDNRNSICPTAAADTNHDGVIDIHETEPAGEGRQLKLIVGERYCSCIRPAAARSPERFGRSP